MKKTKKSSHPIKSMVMGRILVSSSFLELEEYNVLNLDHPIGSTSKKEVDEPLSGTKKRKYNQSPHVI